MMNTHPGTKDSDPQANPGEQPLRFPLWLGLASLLTISPLILVAAAFFIFLSGLAPSYTGAEAIARIAEYLKPSLPATASAVHLEVKGWTEPHLEMRFRLPPQDAEAWLIGSKLCAAPDGPVWWTSSKRVNGQISAACVAGVFDYSITIDVSEPAHWAFFIEMIDR